MAYLVDGSDNILVTSSDNALVTLDESNLTAEPKRLPRGQVYYPDGWHFVRALATLLIGG